jgi:hypothetical protein
MDVETQRRADPNPRLSRSDMLAVANVAALLLVAASIVFCGLQVAGLHGLVNGEDVVSVAGVSADAEAPDPGDAGDKMVAAAIDRQTAELNRSARAREQFEGRRALPY